MHNFDEDLNSIAIPGPCHPLLNQPAIRIRINLILSGLGSWLFTKRIERIKLIFFISVMYLAPTFHLDKDPNPTIHFDADSDAASHQSNANPASDPAPYQSDANLRPLAYRPSPAPF